MTKVRNPVTIENTLYAVLGRISIERASEVTGRAESYLRALSDPDKRERLTIEDAIALDLEHRARGGDGFPLYETYGRIMDSVAAERFADAAAIGRIAVIVAKEAGEATAALIEASLPGAGPDKLETALRELEQSDDAGHAAIALLRDLRTKPPDIPSSLPP